MKQLNYTEEHGFTPLMMEKYDKKIKVAIALSGGVDSAVAAKILCDEGYQLVGFFLKLWSDSKCDAKGENRCCDWEALEDARRVAANLKIPFYVIDAKEEFKKQVVNYFIEEYKNLRTPNPCVVCNQKIKFDLLLNKALQIGCDYLATGHYARIVEDNSAISKSEFLISPTLRSESDIVFNRRTKQIPNSNDKKTKKLQATSYKIFTGVDQTKDQSYNLYHLNQEQLSHIIFPLGEMTKKEVRVLAAKWDLPVKEKAESQEICFFGDKNYRSFLRRYLPAKYFKPGEIINNDGNIIGQHEGLVNYTIGQRKNINQTSPFVIPDLIRNPSKIDSRRSLPRAPIRGGNDKQKHPLYVVGFDINKNQLIVGEDEEVYKKEMTVSDMHWIDPDPTCYSQLATHLSVKIRSQAKAVPCVIQNLKTEVKNSNEAIAGNIKVVFDIPQRAITPGQSAVFYLGDEVLSGGIIVS